MDELAERLHRQRVLHMAKWQQHQVADCQALWSHLRYPSPTCTPHIWTWKRPKHKQQSFDRWRITGNMHHTEQSGTTSKSLHLVTTFYTLQNSTTPSPHFFFHSRKMYVLKNFSHHAVTLCNCSQIVKKVLLHEINCRLTFTLSSAFHDFR